MLRIAKTLGFVAALTLIVAQIVLATVMVVASHTGHKFIIITGGSMEPTYHLGSALIIKELPDADIVDGTPITFRSATGTLTTHRVIAHHDIDGATYLQTQGDANDKPDPDFTDVDAVLGTPVVNLPYGGRIASFLLSPMGRLLAFGPALLFLLIIEASRFYRNVRTTSPTAAETTTETNVPAGSPNAGQRRHLSNTAVGVLVAALIAGSLGVGITVGRSNAVFVDSDTSDTNDIETDTLAEPTGVTISVTGNVATLNWTRSDATYASGYSIFRATSPEGPYAQIGSTTGANNTTYADSTFSGVVYYVVRTTAFNWVSTDSNVATTSTLVYTDTGYTYCTANAADTGGDNNGYETSPANACGAPNSTVAVDANSGNGNQNSCTSNKKDRHRFYNYGITLPAGSTIGGVTVQTVGRHTRAATTANLCVQLSKDGGTTWTAAKALAYPATNANLTTLTFGSATDLWGTSWTANSFTNTNFRVRVINVGTNNADTFHLDSVAVRVTYR
jgi:signal peptidase